MILLKPAMLISARNLTTKINNKPRLKLSNVSSSLKNSRGSENKKKMSKLQSNKDKNKLDDSKLRQRSAGKLNKLKESESSSCSNNNKKLL